jgi:hypothetical protein
VTYSLLSHLKQPRYLCITVAERIHEQRQDLIITHASVRTPQHSIHEIALLQIAFYSASDVLLHVFSWRFLARPAYTRHLLEQ